MATVALTDLEVSVSDVAVRVTVPPVGITAGAVYVVVVCEAMVAGLNEPQAAAPQVAVQITPASSGSFVT
jgi:hypothetical protein